jgi:hypothetical protein
VTRVKVAQRAMDRLEELCVLHQGGRSMGMEQPSFAPQTAAGPPKQASLGRPRVKPMYPGSVLVTLTLLVLLVVGGMIMADPWVQGLAFSLTWIGLAAVELILLCLLLAKVSRYHSSGFLHAAGWGGLGLEMIIFFVGYVAVAAAGGVAQASRARFRSDFNMDGQELLGEGFVFLANRSAEDMNAAVWAFLILGGSLMVLALLALPAALRPAAAEEPAVAETPPPLPAEQTEQTDLAEPKGQGGEL